MRFNLLISDCGEFEEGGNVNYGLRTSQERLSLWLDLITYINSHFSVLVALREMLHLNLRLTKAVSCPPINLLTLYVVASLLGGREGEGKVSGQNLGSVNFYTLHNVVWTFFLIFLTNPLSCSQHTKFTNISYAYLIPANYLFCF